MFYFLNRQEPFHFGMSVLFFIILILSIWALNLILISITERHPRFNKTWIRFALSCIVGAFYVFLAYRILSAEVFAIDIKRPMLIFILVSLFTMNFIVLRIIIIQTKKSRTEAELSDLRIQQLEAQQQNLAKQLQPHFLFNSLSTLKSLIRTNPDLAEEYLVKLSGFLRFSISANGNSVILLDEELRFTSYYIDLQQIRFENTFFCDVSVPDEIRYNSTVPVFSVQTLIENAIKHNSHTESNPLNIKVYVCDDFLIVSNNKIPIVMNRSRGSGIGLENLRRRYSLIAGEGVIVIDEDDFFTVKIKLLKQ